MERLGSPGYSYAQFCSQWDYEREVLQEDFIDAIEREDDEAARKLLKRLEPYADARLPESCQFCRLGRLLCYSRGHPDWEYYARECADILAIRRKDLRRMEPSEAGDVQVWIARGRIDVTHLDWVELLVLNNLAIACMKMGRYTEASAVLTNLHRQMSDDGFIRKRSWKCRAVIYNNLAICLMQTNRGRDAKGYALRARNCVIEEGGLRLHLHVQRTWMEVMRFLGDEDSYMDAGNALGCFAGILGARPPMGQTLEDYLWARKELWVF